jgi:hypothetical protein
MALTAQQLADMQADLAIGSDQSVFTDAELERLFTRANDDYNLAVYYGWRQILGGSAKWVDYQVAQTRVSKGQAFDHIKAMVAFWGDESRNAANQVRIMGAVPVPTQHKPRPADGTRSGYFKRGRWYAIPD